MTIKPHLLSLGTSLLRHPLFSGALFTSCFLTAISTAPAATTVNLNGNGTGRTFDGIGTVLAGGTQKLLMDYPAAQQAEILDFLFKPNFGASLQFVKMEIGGDINSSTGTEPSIQRSAAETPRVRGSALWLARQAKTRRSTMNFSALRWGMPTWANSSDANRTRYYLNYLAAANSNGTPLNLLEPARNEDSGANFNTNWFLNSLRPAMQANFSSVRFMVADEYRDWVIADRMASDVNLRNAVSHIGSHYINTSTAVARNSGKILWDSEAAPPARDSFSDGPQSAFIYLDNLIAKYVDGKMVASLLQPALDAAYENAPFNSKGLLNATTPWSGHYNISPALWTVAHITQFAQPGWKILDSGSARNGRVSYMTFKSPNSTDYSIVVLNATSTAEPMTFNLANLSTAPVRPWRTDSRNWFISQSTITPAGGSFSATIPAQTIWTFSTTTGQAKGTSTGIPPDTELRLPYTDTFESYSVGAQPRLTSDMGGAFEVANRADSGKALRQVLSSSPTTWNANPTPVTFLGSHKWRNYSVNVDARLEGTTGAVELHGRLGYMAVNSGTDPVYSYRLVLNSTGAWSLRRFTSTLSSGTVAAPGTAWHNLRLDFLDNTISCFIDGRKVGATITDNTYFSGMIGLGSGWNTAQYDNLAVNPISGAVASIVRVDDRLLSYTGTWGDGGSYTDYERTTRFTSAANNTLRFTFNGSSVAIIGRRAPANGTAIVSIDGQVQQTIDTFSSATLYKTILFQKTGLSEGQHTISLSANGARSGNSSGNLIEIDCLEYQTGGAAPTMTIVNDNTLGAGANQFNYTGTWSSGPQTGAFANDNHWSSVANAAVTISFTGTRIDLYGAIAPSHGLAAVSIDGGPETTVDYFATARADNRRVFQSPLLFEGNHTLRVRVTATRNPSSTANIVTIDRVAIE